MDVRTGGELEGAGAHVAVHLDRVVGGGREAALVAHGVDQVRLRAVGVELEGAGKGSGRAVGVRLRAGGRSTMGGDMRRRGKRERERQP